MAAQHRDWRDYLGCKIAAVETKTRGEILTNYPPIIFAITI